MQTLRAYLELLRLPTVFTALGDIFLGYLLTHRSFAPVGDFAFLLAASAGLYWAGMIFNDVFDRQVDLEERPHRPLPSGRVSLRGAVILGGLLIAGALLAAAAVSEPNQSLRVAGLLAVFVLAYDGLLKKTPLGPVAMGGCRSLNVMLGASAGFFVWASPQVYIAGGLGVYIIGVTWFARSEARLSRRWQLLGGALMVNLGLLILAAFVARPVLPALAELLAPIAGTGLGEADPYWILLLLAVIALTIDRRLMAAWFDPRPATVQPAIKTMLLSLLVLDATLIYFKMGPEQAGYALATVALLIPALLLARWIPVT